MKNFSSLLLVLALASSCAPKNAGDKSPLSKMSTILGDMFSNRQQSTTLYVGLIQLQLPALLAQAQMVDGKAVIDDAAKAALLAEQDQVIQALKDLSPEIKIVSTYKLVLNAIAFIAPSDLSDKIAKIEGVNKVIENTNFDRPKVSSTEQKLSELASVVATQSLNDHNTVTFIGADKLHKAGISGQNMRVGIIDTGIDYTHAMLGGAGKKEIYDSIDPSKPNQYFPNEKVVGGADFVGTEYSSGDPDVEKNIPKRDANPIDEAGHGSHVSGTIAGLGDGVKTYSGVAPEAKLYALKVFGKEGSTSDIAVIAALEYAADPSEKTDPADHLDVVNLSLGGGYGKPKILYTEAIKNLTKGGTVVVASAGNSGDNPYIVGAPSTADEAISVAASIDDMPQNISIPAVGLKIGDSEKLLEATEGTIGVPAAESHVVGSFIFIGNGADPIAEDVKAAVNGKIALIDRGGISFVEKLKVAVNLGAIGVVVSNNAEGNPIQMGGDGKFGIPAIMITKAEGAQIKDALKNNVAVVFNFSPGKVITRVDLIDTITDFSSRGPRSIDSLIKPEIAGPGANVISAKMGSGSEGVQFSGTSMSGPHITGVMTLLKQAFPKLTVAQLKAKVLNNSKIMMKGLVHVPVSLQGAGRVQVDQAFKSQVIAMPATLSLGEVSLSSNKTVSKAVTLTNFSDKDIVFASRAINSKNIKVSLPGSFKVKANSTLKLNISFTLLRANADQNNIEADGFVILQSGDGSEKINLPFLAVLNKVTNIIGSDFLTLTNSQDDKVGAEVRLTLTNKGQNDGDALVFNLLGTDERKKVLPPLNLSKSTACDLEAAGIRIVDKTVDGADKKVLQVGVKLYDALTMWQPCDISLQIDSDGDGVADLELVGTKASYLAGVTSNVVASLLLDAKAVRDIRKAYETAPKTVKENYVSAIIDAGEMKFYDHSDVAVIEADITKIVTDKKGNIGIKLAVSNLESEENSDDFLADHETKWQKINISENAFAFYNMPEAVTVKANDLETLSMKRGAGSARLLVLYPNNAPAVNEVLKDHQSQILVENFQK
ncbi:MAG: S8 family serine peptidase [Bacteriovorax sp.]|nr:S8 family serine peptidase [Bacteriovorax sp.]